MKFMKVEERFLKYVSYWTTSDEDCQEVSLQFTRQLRQEKRMLACGFLCLSWRRERRFMSKGSRKAAESAAGCDQKHLRSFANGAE